MLLPKQCRIAYDPCRFYSSTYLYKQTGLTVQTQLTLMPSKLTNVNVIFYNLRKSGEGLPPRSASLPVQKAYTYQRLYHSSPSLSLSAHSQVCGSGVVIQHSRSILINTRKIYSCAWLSELLVSHYYRAHTNTIILCFVTATVQLD